MDRGTRFVIAVSLFDEKKMLSSKLIMEHVKTFEYALLKKKECPFFSIEDHDDASDVVFIMLFQMCRRMTQNTFLRKLSSLNYIYHPIIIQHGGSQDLPKNIIDTPLPTTSIQNVAKSKKAEEEVTKTQIIFLIRKGPKFSEAVSAIRNHSTRQITTTVLPLISGGKALFFGPSEDTTTVHLIFSCNVQQNIEILLLAYQRLGVGLVEYAESYDNYNEELLRENSDCENTRRILLESTFLRSTTKTFVAILSSSIINKKLPISLLRRQFEECFGSVGTLKDSGLEQSQNLMAVGRRWPIALKHTTFYCNDLSADLWIMRHFIK